MEKSNVRLDTNSGNCKPEQQRELDSAMEMGQSLAGSKNKGASYIETERVVLLDTFRGGIFQLIDSIKSLVELDMRNALVPHGIGGHARNLLSSAAIRLEQLRQRVAELEERRCEVCGYAEHHREHTGCLRVQVKELTAERDALKQQRDELLAALGSGGRHCNDDTPHSNLCEAIIDSKEADLGQGLDPFWKWAFRRGFHEAETSYKVDIATLEQQRDELLKAAEAIEIAAEECLDFDECTAMLVPIDAYHKLMEAIASVKEKA